MKDIQINKNVKGYKPFLNQISSLINDARTRAGRAVNAILTATYWEIGRRIVEFEQKGKTRAEYWEKIIISLAEDLTAKFGKGFSVDNLENMRLFYQCYPVEKISRVFPGEELKEKKSETVSRILNFDELSNIFPLSWSHYVVLIRNAKSEEAMSFYEYETLRGGWSVRQLKRQVDSQFYERTALSKNKAAMLKKAKAVKPEDLVSVEEEIKDPYILEFLGLKDEYSEHDLEEALIYHLEHFLLEMGGDFTFVGRQQDAEISYY